MAKKQRKRTGTGPAPKDLRLAAGNDQAGDQAEEKRLHLVLATELPTARVEWLWPDRLEWKTTAFLQGPKGAGKSTWMRTLAAHVTGGPRLHGTGSRRRLQGNVLWFAGEEPLDSRVRPGLAAAGANLERCRLADCHCPDPSEQLRLPADCDRLTREVMDFGAALVVVDPVFAFVDGTLDLEKSTLDQRHFMVRLARVAKDTGCLILLSRNTVKNPQGSAVDAGRGGGELGNSARAVLHCQEMPGTPGIYALAVAICNPGRPCPALTYKLADMGGAAVVQVTGEVQLSADDLIAGEEGDLERYLIDRAKQLIRSLIPAGELDSRTIRGKAEAAMISTRTLQAAAKSLGVRSRREGTRESTVVYWLPPKGGWV